MNKSIGKSEMSKLPYIIAVDFDGTLVEDKFPAIGDRNEELFKKMILYRLTGIKVVLWTCRTPVSGLSEAVEFCKNHGLEFDAVNENVKEVQEMFGYDTRKVYANVYLDDKAVNPINKNFMEGVV